MVRNKCILSQEDDNLDIELKENPLIAQQVPQYANVTPGYLEDLIIGRLL